MAKVYRCIRLFRELVELYLFHVAKVIIFKLSLMLTVELYLFHLAKICISKIVQARMFLWDGVSLKIYLVKITVHCL